jgi:pimeloyl-ACP methyl ester carboxylesterase
VTVDKPELPPVLVVPGAGGGLDQGLSMVEDFLGDGYHYIAPSRFGYLRTPLPEDASPASQADAHVCLLDALGIQRVSIMGMSAGALSILQFALHYPERTEHVILLDLDGYSRHGNNSTARERQIIT